MTLEYLTLRNYASRTNDYQDDNANSITNNTVYKQRDCWGWGQKQGIAATTMSETVTLPITYDAVPVPIAAHLGFKTSAAASIGGITSLGAYTSGAHTPTTTNFVAVLCDRDDDTNFNTSYYYAYSWLTRGTYDAV